MTRRCRTGWRASRPNLANHEPVTGAFVGHRRQPSGATRVRVFGKYNLKNTATAAKENVFATVRFIPGTGGRADVLASGGDIAADKVFIGSACWDAQEMEKFRILRQCTKGQSLASCTVVPGSEVGTRTACPGAELRGEMTRRRPATRTTGRRSRTPRSSRSRCRAM